MDACAKPSNYTNLNLAVMHAKKFTETHGFSQGPGGLGLCLPVMVLPEFQASKLATRETYPPVTGATLTLYKQVLIPHYQAVFD